MPIRSISRRPTRRRRHLLVVVASLLVVAGCGSSEGLDDDQAATTSDGPRVANSRFDGSFEIVEATLEGMAVPLAQRPSVEIETEFGGLTVLPGCNTYFGSFTLGEDGTASFTVTGGSNSDCGRSLADQEEAVLAALAAVDQWVETETGFRFAGSGSSLSVFGPAG